MHCGSTLRDLSPSVGQGGCHALLSGDGGQQDGGLDCHEDGDTGRPAGWESGEGG